MTGNPLRPGSVLILLISRFEDVEVFKDMKKKKFDKRQSFREKYKTKKADLRYHLYLIKYLVGYIEF